MQPMIRVLAGLLVGMLLLGFTPAASAGESDAFATVLDARMPGLLDQYHVPGAWPAEISWIMTAVLAWTILGVVGGLMPM